MLLLLQNQKKNDDISMTDGIRKFSGHQNNVINQL